MKETEIKTSDTEEKRRKRKCSVIRKATQWIEEGGRSGDKNGNIGKRIREFLKEKERLFEERYQEEKK